MRVAQLAMRAAVWAKTSDKGELISHLPPTVLCLIAAKSVPQPVRDQVLERFDAGAPPKVDEVKQFIRIAIGKQPRQPPKKSCSAVGRIDVQDAERSEAAVTGVMTVSEGLAIAVSPTSAASPDEWSDGRSDTKLCSKVVRAISPQRLDAATQDPEKQDHIKSIHGIIHQLDSVRRGNLISLLAKLGNISAEKLAACLL